MKIDLEPAPLLIIVADRGLLTCGFINEEVAEELGVALAIVSGVRTFEDILKGEVKKATRKARDLGINVGMKGSEALDRLMG